VKKGLNLDRVVLLGRTFEEYARYFALNPRELGGKKILDVAAGVSSFTAQASERGFNVRAFDRIYELSAEVILPRCERDLAEVTQNIGDRSVYKWDFYGSPDGMREFRKAAYLKFLDDFKLAPQRYVAGALPKTPFRDSEFDLTLVSYLLLVYEEQLSYEFHLESLRELMRITRGEIRIYPIVTFEAEESKYLARLRTEFAAWKFEEGKTDFEFLRNSNRFLKITRA
jgi:hypothetical protein